MLVMGAELLCFTHGALAHGQLVVFIGIVTSLGTQVGPFSKFFQGFEQAGGS